MSILSESFASNINWGWRVNAADLCFDEASMKQLMSNLSQPCYVAQYAGRIGVTDKLSESDGEEVFAYTQPLSPEELGDPNYKKHHGVKYAYYAGAMANGIASEELVIALGKQGILASFGAAGLVPDRVEQAIRRIQEALPNGPYAFNLIHAPAEPALEKGAVERFLKFGVHTVEASAYLGLTPHIVRYRAAGLSRGADGQIIIGNKVIAKISRTEVARHFMTPAPAKILQSLVNDGHITAEQMELAQLVPMADDITAEADSGGHTDNRPFVTLLPSILALKDEVQQQYKFNPPLRVGVGGGVGTPDVALAAFTMGAAFIVTGSINQACIEAGASEHTRKLLAEADMADVIMAPAADMFEMGVKLQVLKRGTLFPMRAQKLYDLYVNYNSIEDIPAEEREKLEKTIFRKSLDDIWQGTVEFFQQRDPEQIERAMQNPKRKMSLIFRWYLGLSSRWSNMGETGREMDYQIWAGPSLGAFNTWVKGSYLEAYTARKVVDVAENIMFGAAYLQRISLLRTQGLHISVALAGCKPQKIDNIGKVFSAAS